MPKSLGQAAYEAWWRAMGGSGKAGWSRLGVHARAAWEAAGAAAVEECGNSQT